MGSGKSKVKVKDRPATPDYKKVPSILNEYPPPSVPTSHRRDVVKPERLKKVSRAALMVPVDSMAESYDEFLRQLTRAAQDDVEKVWSIYIWLGSMTSELVSSQGSSNTPMGYLRMVNDRKGDITTFFTLLCRHCGIPCVMIQGVTRAEAVGQIDANITDDMKDKWAAVFLQGSWRFIHVTRARDPSVKVKNHFFLTEPDEFIFTCLPDLPEWQLLPKSLTATEFLNQPFCSPEMLSNGIRIVNPKTGRIRSKSGKVLIEISSPRQIGQNLAVSFFLRGLRVIEAESCDEGFAGVKSNNDHDDCNDDDELGVSPSLATQFPPLLERYVYQTTKNNHVFFDIVLPVPGIYQFDVHGDLLDNVDDFADMPVMCQFKLISGNAPFPGQLDPLPLAPSLGWGPTPYLSKLGMKTVSHKGGHIYVIPEDVVTVKFETMDDYHFKVELHHDLVTRDHLEDHVSHQTENGILYVSLSVPEEGQYALLVFAKRDEGSLEDYENVCNYLVICSRQASTETERYPKRVLRERLEQQTESGTYDGLWAALEAFLLHNVEDRGEVDRANQKLHYFKLKKGLLDTLKRRNLFVLKESIWQARNSKFESELQPEIQRAEDYLCRLQRLAGYLHPIEKLESKVISEIRSYRSPKPVIQDVLIAVYLMFGEPREYLQEWGYIQVLMAQSGKDSLQKKIASLDPDDVTMESVKDAENVLKPYDLRAVREASPGTAALYVWGYKIFVRRKGNLPHGNQPQKTALTPERVLIHSVKL
ncbi:lim and transglutaminase domain protein ltd-1-like [Ylistrum balloti]|uniref:lim and transglutaminase domain protein ltd-1-like n=1 Tax=Ylistrum balloti TaxID=509963 RepID=UPI002905DA33|nr:lim and transglutaminase domain protein ltd-1-like [Ylistrum balloti]